MNLRLIQADVLDGLRQMADASVHCVVTSPPYWGLRDYGTAQWEGGDPACDHDQRRREHDTTSKDAVYGGKARDTLAGCSVCRKCGATRIDRQIGLESTPDEYVAKMVAVFREVRRVLRDDGTCWVNLGDSYANDAKWGGTTGGKHVAELHGHAIGRSKKTSGLKTKDLCGIPWRVAFALQADGWWLRQDIIWHKPNPMPESVTDRCTKAHEYLFLLTKSARYYYDAAAVSEAAQYGRSTETTKIWSRAGTPEEVATRPERSTTTPGEGGVRNRRSVWTIPTQPFPEAHFATFPPALVEPCILAGTSAHGCCAACSAPTFRDMGWQTRCDCHADLMPATVLDPFFGAGTTGLVALRAGRSAVGIELNPEYAAMAERRIRGELGLLLKG